MPIASLQLVPFTRRKITLRLSNINKSSEENKPQARTSRTKPERRLVTLLNTQMRGARYHNISNPKEQSNAQ